MNKLHLQYKKDTGKDCFVCLESYLCHELLDTRILSDFTKKEILSFIENDKVKWCISQDAIEQNIPSSFDNGDIKLHTDDYVEWLESKMDYI
jgi:hypothetical protein